MISSKELFKKVIQHLIQTNLRFEHTPMKQSDPIKNQKN